MKSLLTTSLAILVTGSVASAQVGQPRPNGSRPLPY